MKVKFFLFLLYFLIIGIKVIEAFPVSPPSYFVDYVPGYVYKSEFRVSNTDPEDLSVIVYDEGELNNSFKFSQTSLVIKQGDKKTVNFEFTVPVIEKPGVHTEYITIKQSALNNAAGSGTGLSAIVAIALPVYIRVPYPGKYLVADLEVTDVALNQLVNLSLILTSLGYEDLYGVYGKADIYDVKGSFVDSVDFPAVNVFTGKGAFVNNASWDSTGKSMGIYNTNVTVYYDTKTVELSKSFRIGDEFIKIINISGNYMKSGQINLFNVEIESMWNKEIPEVYTQLDILNNENKQFKSDKVIIGPWENRVLPIYVDASALDTGEFEGKVTLFYLNKTDTKDVKIIIKKTGFELNTQTILIIVVIILVLFNLWYFLKRNRIRKK